MKQLPVSHKKLIRKRQLLTGKIAAHYELEFEFYPYLIPPLADYCIKQILPVEALQGKLITDKKGYTKTDQPELVDELLYVKGQLPELLSDNLMADREKYTDFFISITSNFDSFQGNHHILHQPSISHSLNLPTFINTSKIGRVFPLKIEEFHIGLEFFRSHCLLTSLGFTPSVTQSFQLIYSNQKLKLVIDADDLTKKSEIPLSKNGIFSKLDDIIHELCVYSIENDWLNTK